MDALIKCVFSSSLQICFYTTKCTPVNHRSLKFKSINVSLYSVFSKAFSRFLGLLSLGRIVFSLLSVLKTIRFTKARFCPATLSNVLLLSSPNVTSRLSENSDNLDYPRSSVIREEMPHSRFCLRCA